MIQRVPYGKFTENEFQMAVAEHRNGGCGLSECSWVYGVPRAAIRRHVLKNWYVNSVKALGRQAAFSGDMEQTLADHIIMLEERFGGWGGAEN
jgi:hypothetical protein